MVMHLLALVGLAPAVVSETYWALTRDGVDVRAITVVTTRKGAGPGLDRLLGEAGALARIAASAAVPVAPPVVRVEVLRRRGAAMAELDDVEDLESHLATLEQLDELVRHSTSPGSLPLFALLAGGRKTMAAALALAMSLHARPQDRLAHVLVAPPWDRDPEFLFPAANAPQAAAAVRLVEAPFVRLRALSPADVRGRPVAELVGLAQGRVDAAAPARLDLAGRTLSAGRIVATLPPAQAALLALLAAKPQGIGVRDLPIDELARAYRVAGASKAAADALSRRLFEEEADAWLREVVSRLRSRLSRDFSASPLRIERIGQRPFSRYRLAPGAIYVASAGIEPGADPS